MTSRLFIVLDIPENILGNLIEQRDGIYDSLEQIKWEGKDKLHITLQFLGDVGENITDLLIKQFDEIKFDVISTKFDRFSFFKKNGILKIMFAGIEENNLIIEFQKIIINECQLLGFDSVNKKYHPHLTILRIKGNEDMSTLEKFNNHKIDGEEFNITSFSIVKSELKPNGSEYSIVKSFKLI